MKYFKIKDYIDVLKKHNLIEKINIDDELLDMEINYITHNSKDVKDNTLYICKGLKYKSIYLKEAIDNGALLYVCEKENATEDAPHIIVNDIRKSLALISILYYNEPASKLNLIGITGTKGKSTTSYYIKSIIDNYLKNKGKDMAIVSSIDVYDGISVKESLITSPESIDLQKIMANTVKAGLSDLVMEVSSQALKLDRVYGLTFDVGAFLNISPDHISEIEHKDYDDYFYSKLKFFKQVKNLVINLDTDRLDEVLKEAKNVNSVITFSTKKKTADIYAYDITKIDYITTKFRVRTPKFDEEFILTMPGLFNVSNALASIGIAYILNIPYENMYEGLRVARTSGRMELHATKDNKTIAIVDYAHNKLSFEKLYESVKSEYPTKKIITVFGCPGGKAQIRRHDLGILSGLNSKVTYLTAEDPGPEDVTKICEEIAFYVKKSNGKYKIIEDREEAIKKAILDNPGCIILITGKGNETRQKYGGEYLPCKTDTECVKEAFLQYENSLISS